MKFGDVLIIRDKPINNLQISSDTGAIDEPIAVFLFTPDMDDKGHHKHIEISQEQASSLHEWLARFLQIYCQKETK